MMTNPNELISIRKAASILSVCQKTLRDMEANGKIEPVYTSGGHRRYKLGDINTLAGIQSESIPKSKQNRVAIYARVSSHEQKQKGDLDRQLGRLTSEASKRKYSIIESFDEVGSGMNDKRIKLHKLFQLAESKQIDVVLVEHKDRLTRFMFHYIEAYLKAFNVRIEWTDEVLGKSYEEELVEDILSLMASFSAKIYGKRSSQNRLKKNELKNIELLKTKRSPKK